LKITRILVTAMLLCFLLTSSYAQEAGPSVQWKWNETNTIPQGKESSSISITLSNTEKREMRLEFVGLHFAWMPNDTYTYGGGSEKTNTLSPGQSITYTIPFGIPKNLAIGPYKCYAAIIYHIADGSSWTKISSAYSPPQVLEIVPLIVVTVTSTTTLSQPADWTVDFAVLLAFTIVGLALLATFRSARRRKERSTDGK